MRNALVVLYAALCLLALSRSAHAQIGEPVVEIRLDEEGRPVADPALLGLVETRIGAPLAIAAVRDTIAHFMSLGRYDDVQVFGETVTGGVRVRYALFPRHPVDRVEFRGNTGVSEDDMRRLVTERFGNTPSGARAEEIAATLRNEYRRRGYLSARVMPRVEIFHDPDRATLVFDVDAGPRSKILDVRITQVDATDKTTITDVPDIKAGQIYDEVEIGQKLQGWESRMRDQGFYQARVTQTAAISEDGSVFVIVNLERGPRVVVNFEGDPLPGSERERLVPIRAEASADEDLLEDSNLAIESYLHNEGYRDASVEYTRVERGDELIITFRVSRGPRYIVRGVAVTGNTVIPSSELLPLVSLQEGDPFVRSTLRMGLRGIENRYQTAGFIKVQVKSGESVVVPEDTRDPARPVNVTVAIVEGPRAQVRAVTFQGNAAFTEGDLRETIVTAPGRVYSPFDVLADRDRIVQAYRDRGYEGIVVVPQPTFAEGDTRADVRFTINEGPQIVVDHIIITGNDRISTETIAREVVLRPGEPYGEKAVAQTRANLFNLELFRSIQIEPLGHAGEPRRDVLVRVEESPATTLDIGGGVEGGYFLRPTGEGGVAQERFELTPRGFFQIGRRNLFGKNRSVTLFTRVSLRSRDTRTLDPEQPFEGSYGFHEYRVLATYREPRVLRSRAEVLLTGISEQAVRSSFNFSRREIRAQLSTPVARYYTLSGLYSVERTKLFDLRASPEELPLIDRLFPQVRLSKFSGTLLRDTRDANEALDPSHGTLMIATGDIAARAIGSEVGFVKSYLQGFLYRQLPWRRRTVVALGARVGVARGFEREVDGAVVDVGGLPASERFFAGGDTSVRGFALDRLGNEETITATGFPTGGNSVVVLNSELRVNLFGSFTGVGFLDAGNVFPLASDLDFTDLRPAAGFGVLYRSPFGPIRVDLGFNLKRRELVAGTLETRPVLHILLGQPF